MPKPKITEAEFQKQVIQLAKLYGWKTAHFRPALMRSGKWATAVQGDGAGFPDTVLVRGSRLIFAELKAGRWKSRNKPKPEQQEWLDALGKVLACETYLWTPDQWDDIEKILA